MPTTAESLPLLISFFPYNKQHDTRTTRRPDCVTEIRMGNSVLVVSGYFKKDTTTTAADKMARVLEAEAAATQEPTYPA